MGQALKQLARRNKARGILSDLMDKPEYVIVIHYSCESFYDRPDGSSPRITSIATRHLHSGQTNSFSIHQVGERKGYFGSAIEEHYNELERLMLDEFFDYVRAHVSLKWLHWNMRDSNYGFHSIAHRYRVLGGQPVEIPEDKLVDLARLLVGIYGIRYIGHPRLYQLVQKNRITDTDFLTGTDEAEAFEQREYVRLHLSTLRKVDILANIAERADIGSLRTDSSWRDRFRLYPQAGAEVLRDHWLATIILSVATVAGLIASVIGLFKQ